MTKRVIVKMDSKFCKGRENNPTSKILIFRIDLSAAEMKTMTLRILAWIQPCRSVFWMALDRGEARERQISSQNAACRRVKIRFWTADLTANKPFAANSTLMIWRMATSSRSMNSCLTLIILNPTTKASSDKEA